ncbi:hypothetical protein IQ229_22800, partial [Nostoc cf. edaphicum LEGE 07299]|nr:hypothetical protein [Nostoc cf. edaphicum LEGE 07299]
MTALGLMKGHLMVANELLEQGTPDQAEPHLGHPVDELYGEIEDQLHSRKVREFKKTLEDLYDIAKYQPADKKVESGYKASMEAIAQAINALPKAELQSPKFVMQVVSRLLETAKVEYEAGIIDNKIVARIEYQDSRGFVINAKSFYDTISANVKQKTPETDQDILSSLEKLQNALPSVNPPISSIKSQDFSNEVTNIQ